MGAGGDVIATDDQEERPQRAAERYAAWQGGRVAAPDVNDFIETQDLEQEV